MSPDELKNSIAYHAVEKALELVTKNIDSIETDKLAYLEMTKHLISTIPESIPDHIVNNSLIAIENLVNNCFGVANQNLTNAANQVQHMLDIKINDEKLVEWLDQQPAQLKQTYLTQKQSKKEAAKHILDSKIFPQLKQDLKNQLDNSFHQYNGTIKSILTDFAFIFCSTSENYRI